jgi:hypothetical protein
MKSIKITFLMLAVIFATSSAFVANESNTLDPVWFNLVGDDPTDANDYQQALVEPTCNADPSEVCAILANEQGSTNKPIQSEVTIIASDSDNFTDEDSRVKYIEE